MVARPHSLGAGGAFGTTFGDGFGLQFACALGSGGAWFSLSLTSPSALPGACVEHCNDAFFGGACVASIGKPFLAVSVEPTRSSLRFSVALSGASLSLSSSDASFDFTSLFGAHGWRTANVSARPTGVADWTAVSGELVREPGCTDDVILLRAASGARVGGAALWDEATWELRSDDGVTCAAKDGRAMLSGVAAERVGDHVVVSFVHEVRLVHALLVADQFAVCVAWGDCGVWLAPGGSVYRRGGGAAAQRVARWRAAGRARDRVRRDGAERVFGRRRGADRHADHRRVNVIRGTITDSYHY